jgi:hypothetical protein|tara:strand:- start:291 stop:590 length:300 start_codon:yes stop_codon:yes gene_type:complete
MNKFFLTCWFFMISISLHAQEIAESNQGISPFSSPEDCMILQYNSGVISKRLMNLYAQIDERFLKNPDDKKIKDDLDAIKKLSDINLSIVKTYETFCKR